MIRAAALLALLALCACAHGRAYVAGDRTVMAPSPDAASVAAG